MSGVDRESGRTFRALHGGPGLLVLPNAWDAGSARLMEHVGAPAVATSSAAVAWARGYPDGNALPVDVLVATVAEVARVIHVPLSVDVEGGYATDVDSVAQLIGTLVDAGAVGINIEDGDDPPDLLSRKIERIRAMAAKRGADLFINARTDVYLAELAPPERCVEETLARAAHYRAAGADGIFVPAIVAADEIRTVVAEVKLPVNVLVRPGLPARRDLEALGVRRLSAGSSIARVLWSQAARLGAEFLEKGTCNGLFEPGLSYGEINELVALAKN